MKKEKIGLYGLVGSNNSANYMAMLNSYVKCPKLPDGMFNQFNPSFGEFVGNMLYIFYAILGKSCKFQLSMVSSEC